MPTPVSYSVHNTCRTLVCAPPNSSTCAIRAVSHCGIGSASAGGAACSRSDSRTRRRAACPRKRRTETAAAAGSRPPRSTPLDLRRDEIGRIAQAFGKARIVGKKAKLLGQASDPSMGLRDRSHIGWTMAGRRAGGRLEHRATPSCEGPTVARIRAVTGSATSIHASASGEVDCFAALAMTGVLLVHLQTAKNLPAAPIAPGVMPSGAPLKTEGAGKTGRSPHPRSPVRKKCTGGVTTGSAETVRPSLRNGLNGLLRALPGDEFVLPPSSADLKVSSRPVGPKTPPPT